MARVLFVNGFNRSGTTLLTAAVTDATGGTTLTVRDLARHLPSIERFLASARKRATVPDRGVDRLPVQESTPEEYGWLLRARTGEFEFGARAAESGILQALVDELAGDGDRLAAGGGPAGGEPAGGEPVVVLKNPWDTGRERVLLDQFAGSQVLLVRRRLGAIEDSSARAWARLATSTGYLRALLSDRRQAAGFLAQLLNPKSRQELVRGARQRTRRAALRLARSVSTLPPDRVAFLSYDELRDDPRAGAAWAAHLVDPEALARAVEAHTFPEYRRAGSRSPVVRAIDWYWARAWRRARAKQVRAGVLGGLATRRPWRVR